MNRSSNQRLPAKAVHTGKPSVDDDWWESKAQHKSSEKCSANNVESLDEIQNDPTTGDVLLEKFCRQLNLNTPNVAVERVLALSSNCCVRILAHVRYKVAATEIGRTEDQGRMPSGTFRSKIEL